MAESVIRKRLVIRGRVQGVWFRDATQRQARALGVAGWVRNRADGSVEAVACGDMPALDALQRWAGHGPPAARVDSVEASTLSDEGLAQLRPAIGNGFSQVETDWD